MSQLFGTPRRGLRAIVRRGPIVSVRENGTTKQTVELDLECGHTVTRGATGARMGSKTAVCPTCKRTDGEKRDRAHKGVG